MILKNVVLVVKDIERSRRFYVDILGLSVTADLGKIVLFAGGVVLEDSFLWENALRRPVIYGGNAAELYFEDSDAAGVSQRLQDSNYDVEFLMEEGEEPLEVLRFYDPDRHIIEVRVNGPV